MIKQSKGSLSVFQNIRLQVKKVNWYKLLACFAVVMIFYGGFARPDYATDTYAILDSNLHDRVVSHINNGRYFTALYVWLFSVSNAKPQLMIFCSYALAIVALSMSLYILSGSLKSIIKDKYLRFSLSVMMLINPFTIEQFLFLEKGIMILAIMFAVIAASKYKELISKLPTERNMFDYALPVVFMLISSICYQGDLGIFIVLATIFTIEKSDSIKKFIINTLLSVFIYVVAPIINIMIVRISGVESSRLIGERNISATLHNIVVGSKDMIKMYGIVPAKIIAVVVAISLVAIIVSMMRHKTCKAGRCIKYVLSTIYVSAVTFLAAVAPQIAMKPELVWVVPRSTYAYGAIWGILLIIAMMYFEAYVDRCAREITLACALVITGMVFYRNSVIISDHYALNAQDRTRSWQIQALIDQRERDSNVHIDTVVVAPDLMDNISYPGIFHFGDINSSAFTEPWSDVSVLNYWTRRQYKKVEPNQKQRNECQSQNWTSFDKSQIKFSGRTMIMCTYDN